MRLGRVLLVASLLGGCSLTTSFDGLTGSSDSGSPGLDAGDAGDAAPIVEAAPPPPPDACPSDYSSDPLNCGRCGRTCGGAACVASACLGITIVKDRAGHPWYIAVDATSIYWTEEKAVMRADKSGANVTQLASEAGTFAMALDATHVYFTHDAGLSRVPKAGGATQSLGDFNGLVGTFVAGGRAYVAKANDANAVRGIYSTDVSSKGPTLSVSTETGVEGLALEGNRVWWTEHNQSGRVMSSNVDGGAQTAHALAEIYPRRLVMDATDVYWLNTDAVRHAGRTSETAATLLTDANIELGDLAVDGSDIYFTASKSGILRRMPKVGGTPPVVLLSDLVSPTGVAVDDKYIFVANNAGNTIVRVSK
jgi:hypothetical protein